MPLASTASGPMLCPRCTSASAPSKTSVVPMVSCPLSSRVVVGVVPRRCPSPTARADDAFECDANQAWRKLLEKPYDLATLQLPARNHLAASINAMHLKD